MPKVKKTKTSVKSHRRIEAQSVPEFRPLDDLPKQILDLMAFLMKRGGFDRNEVLAFFETRLHTVPDWIGVEPRAATRSEPDDLPGEVLSRWRLLARYCRHGQPRPLPATGRNSLTSLILSIDRRAVPPQVIQKLIDTGSIALENGLYRQKKSALKVRNAPEELQRHNMRVVRDLLKTVESNARGQEELRTFEFISIGNVPLSEHRGLKEEQSKAAHSFLEDFDRACFMRSQAQVSQGEMVRVMAAVFFGDDQPLPTLSTPESEGAKDARR